MYIIQITAWPIIAWFLSIV